MARPLSRQSTAPPAWLHWPSEVHVEPGGSSPPPPLVPPPLVPPPQTPFVHSSPAQQPAPNVQAPPAFRQQFSGPSLAIPLSAHRVVPPDWLHWEAAVHDAPAPRVPPDGALPPLQKPFTHRAPPQQPTSKVQAPPPHRQQFVSPPVGCPFQAQSTAPPVCAHWVAVSQAEPGGS